MLHTPDNTYHENKIFQEMYKRRLNVKEIEHCCFYTTSVKRKYFGDLRNLMHRILQFFCTTHYETEPSSINRSLLKLVVKCYICGHF